LAARSEHRAHLRRPSGTGFNTFADPKIKARWFVGPEDWEMDKLNAIFIQQMVDSIRSDNERNQARGEMIAEMPTKPGLVARSRQAIGVSFISTGKFIQGRAPVNDEKKGAIHDTTKRYA
jgi:hypothetical protein